MKLKELSDFQVYALYQNKNLPYFFKKFVDIEFTQRHFSEEYQNELFEKYQKCTSSNQNITFFQKIIFLILNPFLIYFGFLFIIYLIPVYWFILKGYSNKVKQFWQFTALGCLFWLIFVLLFSKYYLFQK